MLIDSQEENFRPSEAFETLPQHLQDFLLPDASRDALRPYHVTAAERAKLREQMQGAHFSFQESALLVGSEVLLIGELLRDASGRLSLQPWRDFKQTQQESRGPETWRTSWELEGSCYDSHRPSVLASNDTSLFFAA